MRMVRKLKTLFSLDNTTILMIIEATFFLGWARIRMLVQPFSKIAPSLGLYMQETDIRFCADQRVTLMKIRQVIHLMSRHTPWDTKCLVRAMAGMKMLERRGIESTLYLGTGKDELGKMIAHAWLRSGSMYITGDEEMDRFTVTGMFAKGSHF